MISEEQYERLTAKSRAKSLVQFFRGLLLVGVDLHLEWDKDTAVTLNFEQGQWPDLLEHKLHFRVVCPEPEPSVIKWIDEIDEATLYLSVLMLRTEGCGRARSRLLESNYLFETWLEVDLRTRFSGRMCRSTQTIADRFGWLASAVAKRQGKRSTGD